MKSRGRTTSENRVIISQSLRLKGKETLGEKDGNQK